MTAAAVTGAATAAAVPSLLGERPTLSSVVLLAGAVTICAFSLVYVFRAWSGRVRTQQEYLVEVQTLHQQVMEAFAVAIDARDPLASGRSRRVRAYTQVLGRAIMARESEFGTTVPLDEAWLESLKAACVLQDVGKLGLPDHVIFRENDLRRAEEETLRSHAVLGAKIVGNLGFRIPLGPIVRHHHERWDGTGFPDGLRGSEIPLECRVIALAEGLDHKTRSVPGRERASVSELSLFVASLSGTAFDPLLARLYCDQAERIERDVAELEEAMLRARNSGAPDVTQAVREVGDMRREATQVFDLSRKLGTTLEVHELVGIVAEALSSLASAHTCVFYLVEERSQRLVPRALVGALEERLRSRTFESGEGMTGWCLANGEIVIDADPCIDLGPTIDVVSEPTGSLCAFPVADQRGMLGVLAFYAATRGALSHSQCRAIESVLPEIAGALRNALLYEHTRESSVTDVLTGLPNSRALYAAVEREIARATRTGAALSLVVLDLDEFKPVNDEHGHQAGDRVLAEIADVLRRGFRAGDIVFRYAGDEFIALLPGSTCEQARSIVARVQEMVASHETLLPSGARVRVGASAGFACFPEDGSMLEELVRRADKAMYQDKGSRRGALQR